MKKLKSVLIVLCVFLLTVGGCGKKRSQNVETRTLEKGSYRIYSINSTENGLTNQIYHTNETENIALIHDLIAQLGKEPKKYASKKVINDDVIVKEIFLDGNVLTLNFESSYSKLPPIMEVLTRAAIVKTLCQLKAVEYVVFNVNGDRLNDQYDQPIGNMQADDFIDGTDVDTNLIPVMLTLYFSNEEGDALVQVTRPVTYDGTITQEQLVLKQLMLGPQNGEKGVVSTIPKNTVVNSVTTKDGICYVDLNKAFLDKNGKIKDQVVIFSVVNSLVELSNINKVQFSIDGKTQETFRESIEFDSLFERNLQIIEGSN